MNGPLAPEGYKGLGIHIGTDVTFALKTAVETGISFPMIIDFESDVMDAYSRAGTGVILFPLAYLVDRDGIVEEIYTEVEPELDDLVERVRELLN